MNASARPTAKTIVPGSQPDRTGQRQVSLGEGLASETGVRYGGLGPRFLALGVDFVLFCAVFFPVTRIVKGRWLMHAGDHAWQYGLFISDPLCLIFLAVICSYFVFLEGWAGATLGKRLLGLRVVRLDGAKPGLRVSLLRNVLRLVDTLPVLNILGVILILNSGERARFGDRVAKTRIVHVR